MAKYNSYPKYKNSGIPWLGEIPEHWEVRKLKYLADCFPSNVDKHSKEGEKKVRLCNYTDVYKNDFIRNSMQFMIASASDEQIEKFKLLSGDVIITKDSETANDIAVPAFVIEDLENVICGYHLSIIRSYEFIDGKYIFRLFQHKRFNSQFEICSNGVTRVGLGVYDLQNAFGVCPPKQEQTAIARFLDYKLAKINRFIQKKKQLIKLLNEQKAAIINQAVTKGLPAEAAAKAGLDANVKMKDSGIEWLGDIPEHWEVRKLKYLANAVLGKMLCNEDKGGYFKRPYLKSKNIQWLNVDFSDVEEMWFSSSELETYRLKKGDLILSEGGEVGKTCMWNNQLEECYIQNSAHKVTINEGNLNHYFLYLFNSYGKKGGFDSIVNRVSIAHLTKDKLINVKCLVPPLIEQQQIVSYIKQETAIINTTISKIEKELALTEEYKTALIAEAVTGKIDVRGYEVPEIVEEDPDSYRDEEIEEELGMVAEDGETYQTQKEDL
ncbi:MAG: hypothetical protein EA412_00515 [Chitinophagaceae bacterium]|nr:MAG: hypothetical protein EA412_00515 [Chitinophagaceae bacterium]